MFHNPTSGCASSCQPTERLLLRANAADTIIWGVGREGWWNSVSLLLMYKGFSGSVILTKAIDFMMPFI
jgi:hypothetical protein